MGLGTESFCDLSDLMAVSQCCSDSWKAMGGLVAAISTKKGSVTLGGDYGEFYVLQEWDDRASLNYDEMVRTNGLEWDKGSKEYSKEEDDPLLVVRDIKAAFPSISQDSMFSTLQLIGLPTKWNKAIKLFYHNNLQMVNNRKGSGISAEAGIRQGCPLSPLTFAVIADPSLRALEIQLGGNGLCRTFVDDNGP